MSIRKPVRSVAITASLTAGAALTFTATALGQPAPGQPTPPPPSRAVLLQAAQQVVSAGAPGVLVQTADSGGGQTLAVGDGDLRTHTPPRPDGEFRIGSVTKTFTATLVLSLVADGRIGLDQPIDHYLPGLLPYSQTITVRQLLEHRSGLFDYETVLWATPKLVVEGRYRDYTPADLVAIATKQPLQFVPGTKFGYSDTDYIVLGMLVEKVTGHSYGDELKRRVLVPAGLHRTYLPGHDPRLPDASARGYEAVDPGAPLTDLTAYNMSAAWASGALVSTADDLNLFYARLLGGHLLPAALLHEMEQGYPAFPGIDYGLGLGHTQMCGQQVWGHVGGVAGYDTYSFTAPADGRQITISVNRSLTLSDAATNAITSLLQTEFCGALPPAGSPADVRRR